jgi:hypothetical protein
MGWIKKIPEKKRNHFGRDASKLLTNHFEDTPREAVKANTLAASLLLGPLFSAYM